MRHNPLHASTVLVVTSRGAERAILSYVDTFTAHRNARVSTVYLPAKDSLVIPWGTSHASGNGFIQTALREIFKTQRFALIVSEWLPNPNDMQVVIRLAHELRVPAVFVRDPQVRPRGRILIATGGGPNVLQQMWVAREMACAWDRPVHLLRIVHPTLRSETVAPWPDATAAPDACSCRLLHMAPSVEIKPATDVVDAITANIRDGDLLVLGAPSALRLTSDFAGSIPHVVANQVSGPLVLLSSPTDNDINLRRLFWGNLIKTGLHAHDKKHALTALIENLTQHNQLPQSSQTDTLDRALRREAIMSTAVNCATAFPHVKLRGFFGIAATMGICPDGVPFDSPDGQSTRFIYLLVTPDGFCEEHLALLAKIARRMIDPKVREALLPCRTPAQVLDILEPREENSIPKQVMDSSCRTKTQKIAIKTTVESASL